MTDNGHHNTLAAALVAVQAELPSVPKSNTADTGSYTYQYADLADIARAIHPVLARHGLAFIAEPRIREDGYVLVAELLHAGSDESRYAEFPLPSGTPQVIGSALTYGRRYLLCALTGVVADADDDGAAAAKAPPTPQRRPKKTTPPPAAADDGKLLSIDDLEVSARMAVSTEELQATWRAAGAAGHLTRLVTDPETRKAMELQEFLILQQRRLANVGGGD